MAPEQSVSLDLCRELAEWTCETGRRLGLLVDRRGRIEAVIIGDAVRLSIPEAWQRERADGRFSGLRLVSTGPWNDEPSDRDLFTLLKLRLDMLVQIAVTEDGRAWSLREAVLRPPDESGQVARGRAAYEISEPLAPKEARSDLIEYLEALEDEFERLMPETVATRGEAPERAILVTIGTEPLFELEDRHRELADLVKSAGGVPIGKIIQRRESLHPRTLMGSGRLEDLTLMAVRKRADVICLSLDLTGSQAQALEDATGVKVVDRTQLILDLFAQSARSSGGKLQVELARTRYLLPRLIGKGKALSRVGGGVTANRGIGSTRGVGEKQLELDRRSVHRRIGNLERQLRSLGRRRAQRRKRRARRSIDHIALVGYTNAGKSTLFNRLTSADVGVADRMFATLDPTVRRRLLPSGRPVVFSDTVGFIRELPEDLVEAFAATLDELRDTRLRLHIVDATDPDIEARVATVREVIARLGLDSERELLVFNKIDLVRGDELLPIFRLLTDKPILVSAKAGDGVEGLLTEVDLQLTEHPNPDLYEAPAGMGAALVEEVAEARRSEAAKDRSGHGARG